MNSKEKVQIYGQVKKTHNKQYASNKHKKSLEIGTSKHAARLWVSLFYLTWKCSNKWYIFKHVQTRRKLSHENNAQQSSWNMHYDSQNCREHFTNRHGITYRHICLSKAYPNMSHFNCHFDAVSVFFRFGENARRFVSRFAGLFLLTFRCSRHSACDCTLFSARNVSSAAIRKHFETPSLISEIDGVSRKHNIQHKAHVLLTPYFTLT